MNHTTLNTPVILSYSAALRNFEPRQPGEAFAYADIDCRDPDLLMCLAASNPEGRFYGLIDNPSIVEKTNSTARQRHVSNITFVQGSPASMAPDTLPPLHYISYDESGRAVDATRRNAVFTLAEKLLLPGGLLNLTYAPYSDEHGALRFLVREFGPEMNVDQAKEFLGELKKLGKTYFEEHPKQAAALEEAIAKELPDAFFASWDEGTAVSQTFNTIAALRPRGFSYAGDADIPSNYVELSVPPEGQQIILSCRDNHLYEMIKDFALNRTLRSDIWCRQPSQQTDNMSALFGGFSYGITMSREDVPSEMKAYGTVIPLSSPLYVKLIELMTLTPLSIGDFLSHLEGKDFAPLDVIGALQILIACGIAHPMRGGQYVGSINNLDKPRLAGTFNQYLDKTEVLGNLVNLASPVIGGAIAMTPREALVIQAVERAGLTDSVAALLPELERIALNPSAAASIMDTVQPSTEMAETMIKDVLERSMIQWYAYGILEAA